MTPEEKSRARDIISNATPGSWSFENMNWIGPALFTVYASDKPSERGAVLFENIEPDMNGYTNLEFITAAREMFPKVMDHIEALEQHLDSLKTGKPVSALPVLSSVEMQLAKMLLSKPTKGEWSWEDDSQIGPNVVTVYAGRGPMAHGLNLFGRLVTGVNAQNNLAFLTETPALFPKAVAHIDALEAEIKQYRKPAAPQKRPGPTP